MNRVIVNLAVGTKESWYHSGQQRLKESLLVQNSETDLFFINKVGKTSNPYFDKLQAIKSAVENGYRKLLWLDCSIVAIKDLTPIWNYIEQKGYYLYSSGYNCAQTSNDYSLQCYNITRDRAETFTECASNVVGINLDTEIGNSFYQEWIKSLSNGSLDGIKWPKEQERRRESIDKRFLFHRQDQTTASLAANIVGIKMEQEGHFISRLENGISQTAILTLKGGF